MLTTTSLIGFGVSTQESGIMATLPARANLVAFWDAADIYSWSGSGLWQNLVLSPADGAAQGDYDLQLGSTSGSDANDPTFVGTVGGLSSSEYWDIDGSVGFELPSNTSFTDSMHHGDAEWEMGFIVDIGDGTDTHWFLANSVTGGGGANRGIILSATYAQYIAASATNVLTSWSPGSGLSRLSWGFDGDVAGPWQYSINGTQTTNSTANTNGDTSSGADRTLIIGNWNGYTSPMTDGRLYAAVLWNKRLSASEVTQFNDAFSTRYGY